VWTETQAQWGGETYRVRRVSANTSGKSYRCPGCDQVVSAATPHVVAWPEHDLAAADRRHWHPPCWAARERRWRRR
jgi:hypothetical protein